MILLANLAVFVIELELIICRFGEAHFRFFKKYRAVKLMYPLASALLVNRHAKVTQFDG